MPDYYQELGVAPDATLNEIKAAYRRLVLVTHPDKVTGKEVAFKCIQEAYDVLEDPTTRRAYDATHSSLLNPMSHIERLTQQRLPYYLVAAPEGLDLYSYFNQLFGWRGTQALTPSSPPQHDLHWEMLHYVSFWLCRRREQLQRDHRHPSAAVKEELHLIAVNGAKISLVLRIIVASPQHKKRLYDAAMGFDDSTEMVEIERLIGGKTQLIYFMKNHPDLTGADAVFDLQQVGCLTPANFKHLQPIPRLKLSDLSMAINDLLEAKLLTQANFDRLITQKKHSLAIINGLSRLKHAHILTQDYFEILVAAGPEATKVGHHLETLNKSGLLNTETINIIKQRTFNNHIFVPCIAMRRGGELNEESSQVAMWQGPVEVHALNQRLDQLVAYGIYLLSCDVEKGKLAMLHGLDLKKELKNFFELPTAEQVKGLPAFKASFLTKLHSKDTQMAVHRDEWKVIVANIAIALTGLGLIALGIHYAVTGQCFFATTQRQKLVDNVAQTNWLAPR